MNLPPLPNGSVPLGKPMPFVRRPGVGIAVLFGSMLAILGVLSLVMALFPESTVETSAFQRIGAVLQDILGFITPALLAAFVVTRLPATFLRIDTRPNWIALLMAAVILMTAMPLINFTVELNESLPLPEWLSSATDSVEDQVDNTIDLLMGGTGVKDLIFSILLIGVLTGISEELFFRGALQGLFASTKLNKHLAVWITAIIFSAMHFEVYGLLPRMLLGAFFGYLLWWTGSLWIPIFAHALNNSVVCVMTWISRRSEEAEEIETAISDHTASDWVTIVLSLVVTLVGMYMLHKYCFHPRRKQFMPAPDSVGNNEDNSED